MLFPIISKTFAGVIYIQNNKWVRKYLLLLVAFNFILFITVFLTTYSLLSTFFSYLGGLIDNDYLEYISLIIQLIGVFLALYISIVIFSAIATTLSSPIYGQITDRVLEETQGKIIDNKGNLLIKNITLIRETFTYEVKKFLLWLVIFFVCFSLNIIPIIGSLIFILIVFLQVIIFAGLDFFEPAFTHEGKTFRERLLVILRNPMKFWLYLFIGGSLATVPILNIVLIPIFTIGGIVNYFGSYNYIKQK